MEFVNILHAVCDNRGLWCATWRGERAFYLFLKRSARRMSSLVMVSLKSIFPGVNGAIFKGCVKVVAVKACSFSLGRNLATSCALFLSYGESLSGCWKSWWPRANLHQCQLRGLRVAGPCFQIRLSKDALECVFWGSEEVLFFP